jgi:phospholipid/cholesterol/gamma-HCH transport system ATP-binding protein
MESDIVKLEQIGISYGKETVLDNITMRFPRGKLIAITGPAGCGKSTLLKIAAGLVYPDRGRVQINGKDIFSISRTELFQMRKEIAFVFQDAALLSNLTVYNNIALPLRYHFNPPEEELDRKVNEMLTMFDLKNEKNLFPAQLSFGQRKLVSFARGLIMEPKIIFFDEPVAGIDAIAREKMVNKILPLRDDPDVTAIMVSHNLDFIKSSADYIALMYNHRLFTYGKRDEILKSNDPILQRILSIIIDEEAAVAEEILGILTGH